MPTSDDQDDERGERQPLPQPVGSRVLSIAASPPQTMCPMRSTCRGLWPGLAVGPVGDRAVAHDQDGVAEADGLLQRVGGQDDRDALRRDRADQLIDLFLGADVEAARRVVEDEHLGLGVQPFRQHHLLLVAAGEVEAKRVDAGRAHLQAVDPARRQPPLLARVDQAVTAEAAEVGQGDVGGDRQEQHQAFDAPFARDVADAEVDRLGRRRQPHLAAADAQAAAVVRGEAGKRARQLLAARADDAGDAEDLAGMQLEA